MLLSRAELEALSQPYDRWHVSIYLPTHTAGDDVLENPIRFKNLLGRAEDQLVEGGVRRPQARDLLSPARPLVDDQLFWQQQSDGLAVFLAQGLARKYRLPLDFDPVVVVSDRFHLKPLLRVLSNNGRFYVLALSQHQTRLLQGTRHRIAPIDLDRREQVPESIVELLRWEDPEMRLQHFVTTEPTLHQGSDAVFHGHGVASQDDPKEKILRYFHRLDAGITDLLAGDDAPLVPVADDFVLARYRQANTYPGLADRGIAVQPDRLAPAELHRRAWDVVQPLFRQAQENARGVYHHLQVDEPDRASNDVAEIVPAAVFQRVEGLFVAADAQRWGTFDAESGQVELHDEQRAGDRDLLSVAAVHTMRNDGWLFVVEPDDVPDGEPVAAVFRY
ncbi:MAG: hypothetical protein U9R72_06840 [Chloroflexota bacterium]|nr:hypothetical protein [Chloroflexota bacterium]